MLAYVSITNMTMPFDFTNLAQVMVDYIRHPERRTPSVVKHIILQSKVPKKAESACFPSHPIQRLAALRTDDLHHN